MLETDGSFTVLYQSPSVPINTLIKMPHSLPIVMVFQVLPAHSMALPIHPRSLVPPTVRPPVHAPPMLAVTVVLPLVAASIRPPVHPLSVNHVVLPLSLVTAAVSPCKHSLTLHAILHPCPAVRTEVLPDELSLSVLLAGAELPFETVAIGPFVGAMAKLKAVRPSARGFGSRGTDDCTLSMWLIIHKLSFIEVTVSVVKLSITSCLTFEPLSLVS